MTKAGEESVEDRLARLRLEAEAWIRDHPGKDPAQEADWLSDGEMEAELAREYVKLYPDLPAAELLARVQEHLEGIIGER